MDIHETDSKGSSDLSGKNGEAEIPTPRESSHQPSMIESTMEASLRKYRYLYENAPDMYFTMASDGTILAVNAYGAAALGYRKTDLVGTKVWEIVHPEDLERVTLHFRRQITEKIRSSEIDFRKVARGNRVLWVHERTQLIVDEEGEVEELLIMCRDVTERRMMEEELKNMNRLLEERVKQRTVELEESRSRFQHLVEELDEVIFTLNTDANLTYVSPAVQSLVGVSARSVLDTGFERYLLPAERVKADRLLEEVAIGNGFTAEFRIVTAGGSIKVVRATLRPIEVHGEITGYQGMATDVTRQKTIQEQLVRSERMAAAGELAASVAHEVNSPLQGIATLLDHLMDRYSSDTDIGADLSAIRDGLISIGDTVKRLLDLTRPEGEESQEIDLDEIVRATLSLMGSFLRKKHIRITRNLHGNLPKILASAQRIGQVLINLVNNSAESVRRFGETPASSMDSQHEIVVTTELQQSEVLLRVSDTGAGIPERLLHRVFEPFFTTKTGTGMGVGLSISRQIVESYGGTITGGNLPEGGAVFTITLPVPNPHNDVSIDERHDF